jgi:beta-glucanase (GH16 family)
MNRTRSWLASACAVVVATAGLTLAAPAQPALASTSLSVSPTAPIAGESFAATGRVSTRMARPVVLRKYTAGAWRTVRTGWTNKYGAYRLAAPGVTSATAFQVVAKAYKGKRQTASGTRTVRPVTQSSSIYVMPQVVQRGTSPASAGSALNSVVAKFSPARPGRTVTFQRYLGGAWVSSAPTKQRSDGTAIYRGTLGGAPIHAVAAARYGAPAIATADSSSTWNLQFDDEFNGTTLDRSKWDFRNEGVYIPGRTRSKSDPRAVTVGNGTVALKVLKDPASSYKYLNGQISTQNHYRFTHGFAAARVKFQQGRGHHGSFWLQSPNYNSYPGSPARSGAEVDIVEFFGRGYTGGGLGNFLYYKSAARKDVKLGGVWPAAAGLKASSDSWWNSYHVFAVDWTTGGYTFYIDGQKLYSTTRALSHTEEFLILSLLSSDWELKDLDRAHLSTKSVMRVDWARVWTR